MSDSDVKEQGGAISTPAPSSFPQAGPHAGPNADTNADPNEVPAEGHTAHAPTTEEAGYPTEHGENSLSDESAWGSPWSAAEAGWDGEEPHSSGTDKALPPYALSDAAAADASSSHGPPLPPDDTGAALSAGAPATPPATSENAQDGDDGEERGPDRPMTLMEHLAELRNRLVRTIIAVGLAFTVCYSFAEFLFLELCRPVLQALPPGSKLIFTALPEAFFVHLQVGLVAAVFMASPYIFYQIWGFIAPGLYDEEKKYMVPLACCSAFFFLSGAAFCYFIVFPFAFTFFVGYANESIAAMPSLSEYLSFALKLLIAFGLIFEMPLFAFFLARMGLITATMMRNVRRYAILVIFIVAAILTPPDVISQLLMAVPMIILYECSILVAATFGKKPKAETDAEDASQETSEKKEDAQTA